MMFLAGAGMVGLLLILPDRHPEDRVAMMVLGLLCVGCGAGLLLAGSALAQRHVVVANWLGILIVGAAVGTIRPVLLVPCFFAWPLLGAGTYLPARRLAIDLCVSVVTFAVALFWLTDPVDRGTMFVSGVGLMVVICVVTTMWHSRVDNLLAEAQFLATRDPLTGLLNRRAFLSRLEAAGEDPSAISGLVMLDVDHFKQINDRFGHPTGDTVLRRLAAVLLESVRADHAVGRLGGEEFALFLPGCDEGEAARIAARIRERVGREIFDGGLRVCASFGVAAGLPAQGEQMLVNADRALYVAKQRGRDRVVSWSECDQGWAPPLASPEAA
ncbi:MAG: GGDEF domain-containing protein [Solirubrobacteraceae bacterium]|nr:GGDEF domain-containing protein [Solirubrobacteraceae bacterium]